MALLESIIPLLGIALCVLAALPLALWSAQSLLTIKQDRQLFRASQELLRQQILNASGPNATVAETAVAVSPDVSPCNAPQQRAPNATAQTQPQTHASNESCVVAADGRWKSFRTFRVAKLVRETELCTSVYLQPEDGLPIADFQPGQHLPLKFSIPGQPKPVVRCYSLSDGPGKNYYRVSVKRVPGYQGNAPGLISNHINQQLAVGDRVESRPPAGHFVLDTNSDQPVVMLAGGIGITPMISMLEVLRQQYPQRLVVLAYGVRNKADQTFSQYLRQVTADHQNIYVVNCYSKPDATDVGGVDYQLQGFVTIELLKKLLQNQECQYYLCGPPPFMESLYQGLVDWPIPESRIFFEAFGPASIGSKKSKSNAGGAQPGAAVAAGAVTFATSGKKVDWSSDFDCLLELAEANGVAVESGCRAGSCGTCATNLISGSVSYPDGQDVDCEPGQCLTCIARPNGPVELGA